MGEILTVAFVSPAEYQLSMQSEAPVSPSARPRWSPTLKLVVTVLLILGGIGGIYLSRVVLFPLIVGSIIAYLMYPLVRRVRQNSRIPHGLATTLLYITVVLTLSLLAVALAPVIADTFAYLRDELISAIEGLSQMDPEQTITIAGISFEVRMITSEVTTALIDFLRSLASQPFELVFGVAETFLLTIFTFLIGFYLTRDARRVIAWLQGIAPPQYREDLRLLLAEINVVWSSFFRGQVILAVVVTVIITVISTVIGLPQPLLMGIFAGLMEFLPSVGHAIWIITAMIIALIEGSTTLPVSNLVFVLIVAAMHTVFTQLDLNFLIPRIIGRQVRLHPMVVIIGIIIGASIGGVLGVALAAPTIATLRILGRYLYAMLFDLDPFPMVGPPNAPQAERIAVAASMASSIHQGDKVPERQP